MWHIIPLRYERADIGDVECSNKISIHCVCPQRLVPFCQRQGCVLCYTCEYRVHTCLYLFCTVMDCVYTCMYCYILVYTRTYVYVLVHTRMSWYIPVCTGTYWYILGYTGMYRYIQVCTGTYRYVPVHTRKNKNVAYAFQLISNQRPPAYQRLVSPLRC